MANSIGSQLLGVSILFLITSLVFVALRCYVRVRLVKAFGPDDWLMVAALVNLLVPGLGNKTDLEKRFSSLL